MYSACSAFLYQGLMLEYKNRIINLDKIVMTYYISVKYKVDYTPIHSTNTQQLFITWLNLNTIFPAK